MTVKNNRVGEESFNRFASRMVIIKYNNARDMIVMFDNGYTTKTTYYEFKHGIVRNPYDKSVLGVGYLGEGIYKSKIEKVRTKEYMTWENMLRRCYDEKYHNNYPTYKECQIHSEWHNFQNFAKWYNENYYMVDEEVMCLDKDVLSKGNKIYSPDNCIFVPQAINLLLVKNDNRRNKLPIGVCLYKDAKKYEAMCYNGLNKQVKLGSFDTPEEAFYAYKASKEKTIKEVAERYKSQIPSKLYDALVSYEVEIDD